MRKIREEAEPRFDALLKSLISTHPGKCLYFNALDDRYLIADNPRHAAHLWRERYGELRAGETLEEGDYLEIISNTIPKEI